ncbi:MAG: thiol peroxidase [Bacteroides sp.]|nr:thiol peroxidase [Bacteroides sp.]
MSIVKFKGRPVRVIGEFIKPGVVAPDFELVRSDLTLFSLHQLSGRNVVLNIFPSLDTKVCALTVRKFNQLAAKMPSTVVLAISKDLPFAHARFCTAEGIKDLITLSDFRYSDFDEAYGVRMADGPLAGLLARAVVVIGKDGLVKYAKLMPEVTEEPDYEEILSILRTK